VAQTTLIRVNLNAGDLTAEEPNHGGVAKFMQEGCKTFPGKDDPAVPEDEHERKQARKLRDEDGLAIVHVAIREGVPPVTHCKIFLD